jgi:Ni/Co efflux regulator RcnB
MIVTAVKANPESALTWATLGRISVAPILGLLASWLTLALATAQKSNIAISRPPILVAKILATARAMETIAILIVPMKKVMKATLTAQTAKAAMRRVVREEDRDPARERSPGSARRARARATASAEARAREEERVKVKGMDQGSRLPSLRTHWLSKAKNSNSNERKT